MNTETPALFADSDESENDLLCFEENEDESLLFYEHESDEQRFIKGYN